MNKKNKKLLKKLNQGFSLVELIIWVSIVAIFGSIIGFSAIGYLSNAKVTAATQQLNIFKAALLQYYSMEGTYPSESEWLNELIKNKYISAEGKGEIFDPWKNPYEYIVVNDGEGFILKSMGSDKREGGEGSKSDITVSEGDTSGAGEGDDYDYGSDFDLNN